ncbi:MAG: tetratricopeptide repeat protein [Halioglobus sp.]
MNISAALQAMRDGRLADARYHLEQLIEQSSDKPELHYNLAMVLIRMEDFSGAAQHFRACLKHAPDNVDLLNNLANALRLSGQQSEALETFNKILRLSPTHPPARCNRGWLFMATGDLRSAESDFRATLGQSKDIEEAWRGLADALLAQGKFTDVQKVLQESLTRFPDSAGLQNSMGVLHVKMRTPASALASFNKAVSLNPEHAEALTNLGITAEQLGDFDLAEKSLQHSLRVRPGHASTHFHLAHLATHQSTPAEISALESALADSANDDTARIDLEFALGKSCAKMGEYERAFQQFSSARKRLHQTEYFDNESAIAELNAQMHYKVTLSEQSAPEILFITGMPRSGTTLTDQILAAHSQVCSLGESGALLELHSKLAGLTKNSTNQLNEGSKSKITAWLRQRLKNHESAPVTLDTSPGQFANLGLLAELLPEARFILCTRNAIDNCVSIFEQPLTRSHGYANTLEHLGQYYSAYEKLMAHWKNQLQDRLYIQNYEALIASPEQQITSLLEHCELPFEQACTDFHLQQRAVLTPSAAQVRQPLNSRSIGRWRHYEHFLGELISQLPGDHNQPE